MVHLNRVAFTELRSLHRRNIPTGRAGYRFRILAGKSEDTVCTTSICVAHRGLRSLLHSWSLSISREY